jgi:hypothetical protein
MRIWSLHPKYLDPKGLVALRRETLLAKHVLEGRTKGYRSHPQLDRFKKSSKPIDRINQYLAIIYTEALWRNYNFNKEKVNWNFETSIMSVTTEQMKYETEHLLNKLKLRDQKKFKELCNLKKIDQHPLFKVVKGDIENRERI